MPMKNPPHPGRIVQQECLEATGLSVTDAAKAFGVSRRPRVASMWSVIRGASSRSFMTP
ncbi:MAG TPA: hypothetical protein VEK34_12380 [Methylocella sp.]|nr:hypothetical protein [Methylocella sp.]